MPIAGKIGAVFVQTSDAPASFSDELMVSDEHYKTYTNEDSTMRYWDKNTPVTVEVNEIPVTEGFAIEYCGGVIVFDEPLTEEDVVTVSGKHLNVQQHGGFFNWSADLEQEMGDVTTYQSNGWKENIPTIKGFSASAESYWGDSEFFSRLGQEVIIALYIDTTASKARYEGYGIISSDSIETTVDDIINESIEMQGTGKLYYREGE